MTVSISDKRFPRQVAAAELLFGSGIFLDSIQSALQFDQRLDGVSHATGVGLLVLTPVLLTALLLLATRRRSRAAALLIIGLVAIGAAATILDVIIQGEVSLWWLLGGTAIVLQCWAALLLMTAEGRRWLRPQSDTPQLT